MILSFGFFGSVDTRIRTLDLGRGDRKPLPWVLKIDKLLGKIASQIFLTRGTVKAAPH